MNWIRTRYLIACVVLTDAALAGVAVPLQRYSWTLVKTGDHDPHTVIPVLLANCALMVLVLCGLASATVLAQRGAWFLLRRYAVAYARAGLARRTTPRL